MKVYYLEMHSPEALRPKYTNDLEFRILETAVRQWQFNKYLYALVGHDWQWVDKLGWADAQWRAYAEADNLRTWVAYKGGTPAGYFELEAQEGTNVEIAYFGLAPGFMGQGFGGALLTEAITQAWGWGARRVWVHTCTLDHPGALANYQARGFTLYNTIET